MKRTEKIAAKVATTDAWVKAHANGGDLKADIEYLLASNAAAEKALAEANQAAAPYVYEWALRVEEENATFCGLAEAASLFVSEAKRLSWPIMPGQMMLRFNALDAALSALPKDSSEAEGKNDLGRGVLNMDAPTSAGKEPAVTSERNPGSTACSSCGGDLKLCEGIDGQYSRCLSCGKYWPALPKEAGEKSCKSCGGMGFSVIVAGDTERNETCPDCSGSGNAAPSEPRKEDRRGN